jgi:Xaa-Pro aminopeptidase
VWTGKKELILRKCGGNGVRLEDNFLVTETGCEVLSKFYFEERLLA